MSMRKQLPEDEYIRQLLCINVAAKTLFGKSTSVTLFKLVPKLVWNQPSLSPMPYTKSAALSLGDMTTQATVRTLPLRVRH